MATPLSSAGRPSSPVLAENPIPPHARGGVAATRPGASFKGPVHMSRPRTSDVQEGPSYSSLSFKPAPVQAAAARPARPRPPRRAQGPTPPRVKAYLSSVPAAGVAHASLRLRPEPWDPGLSFPAPSSTEPTFFRRGAFKLGGPLTRASHWSPPSSLIGCFLRNKDSPRCACALVLLLAGGCLAETGLSGVAARNRSLAVIRGTLSLSSVCRAQHRLQRTRQDFKSASVA